MRDKRQDTTTSVVSNDHEPVSSAERVELGMLPPVLKTERPRILLVDEPAPYRHRGREQLEIAGFEVAEAGTDEEVVETIRSFQPDVVLVNADLHGTDSFALCSKIRSTHGCLHTPIVLSTVKDDPETLEQCYASGAMDVVQRPVPWLVLSQRMRRFAEHHRTERHLRQLTQFDPLTNLPNRAMLLDILERILSRDRRAERCTAILCLDIERFGEINTTFGESSGDWLLKQFANRLRATVRRSDYVSRDSGASTRSEVARLGSDKFIIILSDLKNAEGGARAAQRLHDALRESFSLDGREVYLSATIGIAVQPSDGPDPAALLRRAESALRQAKTSPRTKFQFFDASTNYAVKRKLEIAVMLRKAVERDELFLCYQPLVDCSTRETVGVEALLRWRPPVLGLVSPTTFIPIAEESGLMVEIGDWVLDTACRQMRRWLDSGFPPLRLSVNLSACQLRQPRFAARVIEILQEAELEPRRLELELTERSVVLGDEVTLDCLRNLKEVGVKLAVDDFGTGSSSIGYLKAFPLDILKIDRSFIEGLQGDSNQANLVAGIIALAHRARLKVIAEGVETEDELSFLQSEDCDEVQGFLFSRPIVAGDVGRLVD